ncbi:MAG: hypothetical protein AAGH68_11420 [Pseudomonadota bacterium]
MTTCVVHRVGPGETYRTLAHWASALPVDLVHADQVHVAELTAGGADPGGVVIRTICDDTRYVEIRPAPGHGFAALTDPIADPVAPGCGLGAIIHCREGDTLRVEGAGTRLRVRGLQIFAEDGAALADDEAGRITHVANCLIEAVSAAPAVTIRGTDACLTATGIVQRGCGDGVRLADGARAEAVTVLKPDRTLADGLGVTSTGPGTPHVRGTAVFGFRQAFGYGLDLGPGLACDQANVLQGAENFADPGWRSVNGATVDAMQTLPGPFAVPLRWLGAGQSAYAHFEQVVPIEVPAGRTVSFSVLTSTPTLRSSGLALRSAAGNAALKVHWVDQPASTTLVGQSDGLAAVDGGITDLGCGCARLWLQARNLTGDPLEVQPLMQVASGVENAGMNLGLYAGCAMLGIGHLGSGFARPEAVTGVALTGLDPQDCLRGTSAQRLDLRPIEGGPLDITAPCRGADLMGRRRLAPETIGALTLNPAPRFVTEPVRPALPARARPTSTEERPRP